MNSSKFDGPTNALQPEALQPAGESGAVLCLLQLREVPSLAAHDARDEGRNCPESLDDGGSAEGGNLLIPHYPWSARDRLWSFRDRPRSPHDRPPLSHDRSWSRRHRPRSAHDRSPSCRDGPPSRRHRPWSPLDRPRLRRDGLPSGRDGAPSAHDCPPAAAEREASEGPVDVVVVAVRQIDALEALRPDLIYQRPFLEVVRPYRIE